ncbi:protein Turandot F [Drosophila takahashii]|uniref:protein Turandot F n=1 Tax=Drosophila takahashii TaxID=29030 RepID=UPI003898F22C
MSFPHNFTILIGCLLVILGCLFGAGQAQNDPEFTYKGCQMLAIFGNQSVDINTKNRNLPALVEFYEKYSNRLQLNAQERSYANNVERRCRTHNPREWMVCLLREDSGL